MANNTSRKTRNHFKLVEQTQSSYKRTYLLASLGRGVSQFAACFSISAYGNKPSHIGHLKYILNIFINYQLMFDIYISQMIPVVVRVSPKLSDNAYLPFLPIIYCFGDIKITILHPLNPV